VAVYNQHWSTLGGGEQLAGGVAAALARHHDVELLVVESFDAVRASERLGFDLTPFPQVELDPGTREFLDLSSRYELLVNTSFANNFASRAAKSLYYVHFPVPSGRASRYQHERWRLFALNPLHSAIEYHHGFWMPEFPGYGAWTKGDAVLDLVIPRGVTFPFGVNLSARAWPPGRRPHACVEIDGRVVFDGLVTGKEGVRIRETVTGVGVDWPVRVRITSDTFVPRLELGADDDRTLGVVVSHAFLGRRLPTARLGDLRGFDGMGPNGEHFEFLESYDVVASNSPYTARWVRELWGRESVVLPPPVQLRRPGAKRPIILSVGRFFPESGGHSKNQLRLVEAFRIAVEQGLDGWELHLVGGCTNEHRGYVEQVRRAAVGLPVRFHVNARGQDLDRLYEGASVFWHAAGFGQDEQAHPDRFEHFGIGVVEAMSAGAVPMVYEKGGPADIVQGTGCGHVYSTLDELASRTVALVGAPERLEDLSGTALRAAPQYAFDRFAANLDAVIDDMEPAST
jgi:glycosyltransferase involved in cell wall biosynthesis